MQLLIRFFGPEWDEPPTETSTQVDAPVGMRCVRCDLKILADESGIIIPKVDVRVVDGGVEPVLTDRVWHKRCITVALLG